MMCLFCDTAREDRKRHDEIAVENARLQERVEEAEAELAVKREIWKARVDLLLGDRDHYKALAERRKKALVGLVNRFDGSEDGDAVEFNAARAAIEEEIR